MTVPNVGRDDNALGTFKRYAGFFNYSQNDKERVR